MQWLVPYTRLDSEQLGIIQSFKAQPNRNLWITGYAGSGKSVLLIHILLAIKEKYPSSRVAIVAFTHALIDQLKSGIPMQYKSNVPVMTPHKFLRDGISWDFVLVDEVQDLKHEFFIDLEARGSKVIAAGDMNQSIYENTCPEDDIIDYLDLDIHRLRNIHRLSRNARMLAAPFCEDKSGFMSASMGSAVELKPKLVSGRSYDEELSWLTERAFGYAQTGYHSAILLPSHQDIRYFLRNLCEQQGINSSFIRDKELTEWEMNYYNEINFGLRNAGLPIRYLGNGAGSLKVSASDKTVNLITYHSAKGLDFEVTFLPFLTKERIMPSGNIPGENLFFVALTRAREQMFLSYNSGNPHRFLGMIDRSCLLTTTVADELTISKNSNTDLF